MSFLSKLAGLSQSDLSRRLAAWNKCQATIAGNDDLRIDCDGRPIKFSDYGLDTAYGWEIDHIIPLAAGGTDDPTNLRARNRAGNRAAGSRIASAKSLADILMKGSR
jgi:hypothetical protein